nr:SURF1 family protein [Curvibacter sp. CHRR-16]
MVTSSPSSRDPLQPVPKRTAAAVLALVLLFLVLVFMTLGTWQLQRRVWKLDLIAKVEARLRAEPVPLLSLLSPAPVDASALEYRRVQVSGRWLSERGAWVVAATELGSGYWLMMPLVQNNGAVVWVNRGYVSQQNKGVLPHDPEEVVQITGLVRKTEPQGTVLRANQAEKDRWYSRDIAALSSRAGLQHVAPLFVDADSSFTSSAQSEFAPVGGLTVVRFANNHLQYALTWFAMAFMAAWGAVFVWRQRSAIANAEHD